MKTILSSIIFFLIWCSNAQIAPILDHIWTIEQIDTGTQIINADPNPLGEEESYNPTFSFVSNNVEFYYNLYAQCEYFLSFDDNNSSLYHHLQGCAQTTGEISQIAQYFNFTFIQQNTNIAPTIINTVSFGPLTYSFRTVDDIIYLDITNTIGEVATFYANNLSQEEFLKDSISIYPNPVKDILQIESVGVAIDKVKIYDLSGRLLDSYSFNSYNQIDVSDLQSGVYILKIETKHSTLQRKLIKN